MNFLNLYKKISNINNGLNESEQLDECPCQDEMQSSQPKQQDSVNMNVSINGQGANGIRDLMNILRNIDDEESSVIINQPAEKHDSSNETDDESDPVLFTDEYENSVPGGSDTMTYAIDSVIGMGDDLHGKGKEAAKQAGGGNPWNVKESLINQLKDLYEEVKRTPLMDGRDGNYNLPGPGDVTTWPKDIGRKSSRGVSDYESDYEQPDYKHSVKKHKPILKWDNSKEGKTPNGERYNTRLLIKGASDADIREQIHLLEKNEWGAKKLVHVDKKKTDDGVFGVLYIVDNHKYGMWKPWKDDN